jgi:hypothetical protein
MNEEQTFNLEAFLQEDAETAAEADALRPLLNQLRQADTAPPTAVATDALITALLPEMPAQPVVRRWPAAVADSWLWLLLQSQLRVVRQSIWAASTFIMIIGVIISILWQNSAMATGLPFILIAPVVAAIGIASLYGADDRVWELEMTTAVPPHLLLLVRLLLVFGFDLILAVAGSFVLSLALPHAGLWSLITTWLAPMTFLAALAFFITILSGATEIGIIVSMALWVVQIIRLDDSITFLTRYWPNLLHTSTHPALWIITLLIAAYTLWLGGHEERWINQ